MCLPRYLSAVSLAVVLSGVVTAQNSTASLPVLDLGYALHRAADFNVILKLPVMVNFSNDISLRKPKGITIFPTSAMLPLPLETFDSGHQSLQQLIEL